MLTPIKHILPQTLIRRQRRLPREGRVAAREGQTVRATDVIATAQLQPRHRMLDVAAGLGVSRSAAGDLIERYEDETVEAGDVIARKTGVFNRIVRSPVAGRIVLITEGYVLLEEQQEPFRLLAGLPGEVVELEHNFGVVIEAAGALIQGYWGNGRIDYGVLTVVAEAPDEALRPDAIDVGLRGSVLVGGVCTDIDVFRRAAEQRLRGLILGSMSSEFLPTVRKLEFPVLLTDGFGRRPMNPMAFRLLKTSGEREIAVNAEISKAGSIIIPEAVIPLQAAPGTEYAHPVGRLAEGQTVRIVREPHLGAWGTVEALLPGRTRFPNGLRLAAARVRLENGDSIPVPLANLEIVNNN